MKGYEKGRYSKVELSNFELQMICAIVDNCKYEQGDFFTKENLRDLKQQLTLELNKAEVTSE